MLPVSLACVVCFVACLDVEKDLASDDRTVRVSAIEEASRLPEIPKALLETIVVTMRRDIDEIFTANGAKSAKFAKKLVRTNEFKFPVGIHDTTIVRIRTDPASFYDQQFDLVVGLSVSDSYPLSGAYDRKIYAAYSLDQFSTLGLTIAGSSGIGYIPRDLGLGLAEKLAISLESGATRVLARLKCTIRGDHAKGRDPERLIEILDFQYLDLDKIEWRPWSFDGLEAGARALKHGGLSGMQKLAGMIVEPRMYVNPLVDEIVRTLLGKNLANTDMDQATKSSLATMLRASIVDGGSRDVQAMSRIAAINKAANLLDPPLSNPNSQPRDKPPDPAARAARASTLLQAEKNLEKAGNTKAARETYTRIVKEFADTPSAKAATERISAIGGK